MTELTLNVCLAHVTLQYHSCTTCTPLSLVSLTLLIAKLLLLLLLGLPGFNDFSYDKLTEIYMGYCLKWVAIPVTKSHVVQLFTLGTNTYVHCTLYKCTIFCRLRYILTHVPHPEKVRGLRHNLSIG